MAGRPASILVSPISHTSCPACGRLGFQAGETPDLVQSRRQDYSWR